MTHPTKHLLLNLLRKRSKTACGGHSDNDDLLRGLRVFLCPAHPHGQSDGGLLLHHSETRCLFPGPNASRMRSERLKCRMT
eukprot:320579-Amphidinium_carterae.1